MLSDYVADNSLNVRDICGYVLSNALLNPGLLCAMCARFEPGKLPIGCGLARPRRVTDMEFCFPFRQVTDAL